uniref:HMA domain-containing protein n=1 Tax=Arcella intermedia TaxID=1963864 RepID=A0A6B2KXD4_9EUKA
MKKECSQGCCENEISENEPTKPVPKENFSTTSKTVQLCIEGMDCNGCAVTLENHLKKLPGVNMVQTSVLTGISVVYYEPLITTPEKIVDHINLSSLTASISADSTAFNVVLMNTVDANEVMEFLEGIVGVLSVKRNDSKEDPHRFHFLVNYNPSKIGVRTVLDMLKEQFVDFAPDITKIVKRNYQNDINNERNLKMKFWASLILTIPIIISAWILPATFGEYNKIAVGGLPVKFLVNWVFASPIQLFLALPIYESCYSAARYAHDANMDTLIALSTTIAYLYSVGISTAILIIGSQSYSILHETFFETSSLVITLVLLGRYLENYTKRQTSSSLSKLMELQPETAILYSGDVEIPFYMIQRGDILKVLPGTKIPTDGIVVTGKTSIDESILTGESLPVKKEPNSILYGGTLNTEGMITMKVTRVPGETELDSIARQLENTQMNKAKIESITDKISSKFVFVILLIALVVFIIWLIIGLLGVIDLDDPVKSNSTNSSSYDSTSNAVPFSLNFALAVLIVSCPCAIGLAAPTAVLVGAGVAAKKFQILFKGGDTIEQCAKVNTICFDKTGTLTEGKLKLIDVKIKKTKKIRDKESFLFYVASAEVASEHPIGKSVVKYYKQQLQENILLPSLETPLKSNITPGKGIEASLKDSTKIHVGSASFLKEELNLQIPQKFLKQAESHQNRGAIVVFAAIDGKFSGLVAVSDTVKETSLEVIQMLNKEGYEIWMVTGDHKITAQVIANQLGIQNYIAEVSPGEKATFIKDLQEKGRKVVMLGDGVNDAVALSQSNVGIAVGKAADLSVEVADIILLTDNLKHLLIALDLSKTIYNRIKINLVWAFGYNIIMIPLAAGVFYYPGHVAIPPAFAGLSDLLSSVPVIIFSLLLHYYNPTLLKPNKTKSKSVVDIV